MLKDETRLVFSIQDPRAVLHPQHEAGDLVVGDCVTVRVARARCAGTDADRPVPGAREKGGGQWVSRYASRVLVCYLVLCFVSVLGRLSTVRRGSSLLLVGGEPEIRAAPANVPNGVGESGTGASARRRTEDQSRCCG